MRGRCIFLTPDGRHLLVANYVSGIAVLPVQDGGHLGEAIDVHQDQGLRVRNARLQPSKAALPLAIITSSCPYDRRRSQRSVCLFYRSRAQIYQYRLDNASGKVDAKRSAVYRRVVPGAGPRHFVFTPQGDGLWLINEEASTLTFYHLDKQSGLLREGKTLSRCPKSIRAPVLPPVCPEPRR